MSALAREFEGLERGLESLLSGLEGPPAAETAPLEAAFAAVESAFTRVRGTLERAPDERAGCEERLARCLRLYAVAVGMLDGLREAFVRERTVCTQARVRLERLHAGAHGASCDLQA